MMTIEPSIQIEKGYQPGIIGRICELHAVYYHLNWGFGLFFEAKVATELAAFLQRYDETRDGIWSVAMDGRVEGGIVIDGLHAEEILPAYCLRHTFFPRNQQSAGKNPFPLLLLCLR